METHLVLSLAPSVCRAACVAVLVAVLVVVVVPIRRLVAFWPIGMFHLPLPRFVSWLPAALTLSLSRLLLLVLTTRNPKMYGLQREG